MGYVLLWKQPVPHITVAQHSTGLFLSRAAGPMCGHYSCSWTWDDGGAIFFWWLLTALLIHSLCIMHYILVL